MSSNRIDWKGNTVRSHCSPNFVCETRTERLNLGRVIIRAIAEYDNDFYDWVTKEAEYPCNDEDKYHDGTADYDDDVDIAEMNAIIDHLSWVVGAPREGSYQAMLDEIISKFNGTIFASPPCIEGE